MPAFNSLSDQEIADVAQYVRANFGKKHEKISPAEVARLRSELRGK
jgi:mono/diheme cytochrome c family protein